MPLEVMQIASQFWQARRAWGIIAESASGGEKMSDSA
jgi:hypothetical protein